MCVEEEAEGHPQMTRHNSKQGREEIKDSKMGKTPSWGLSNKCDPAERKTGRRGDLIRQTTFSTHTVNSSILGAWDHG